MENNRNVDILVGKIISSEKLIQEFSKLDSLDQAYDFCQTIHDGYTKEEFALFIDKILSSFIKESSMDISLIKGIKDADIESVSGGAKVNIQRVVAASLASLFFISIPKFNDAHAVDTNNIDDTAIVQQHQEQEESGTFSRIWSRVKAKLSSLKDIIVRNKGKVTIGALILAAIGVCIYKRKDIKNLWDKWNNNNNLRQSLMNYDEQKLFENSRFIDEAILCLNEECLTVDDLQNKGFFHRYASYATEGKEYASDDDANRQNDLLNKDNIRNFIGNLCRQNCELGLKIEELGGGHWYSSIPTLANMVFVGGGIVAGAKTIWDFMYKGVGLVSLFSKAITDFNNAQFALERMAEQAQYQIDLANEKSNKREFNRKEAGEKLEAGLAIVRGQERAKKGVRGFFNSVTMEKERLKATGQKDSHAHVVVFNGASGTGKSFTAGHLASAISTASPYVMSASEVDVNSSKSSIVGQLFGDSYGKYGGYYGYGGQQEQKNFVKYIEDHPNDGVVIINEYDKMCVGDSKDHPLDEVMRTFIDEGKATINGQTIDCSGVVFILTTNESDGSLQGKVYADSNGKLVDPTVELDTTGSRTIVKHDKSFLNRLTIVSFDNLSAQEYGQIARDKFAPTIDFLKTDVGGNIDLVISDESYDRIAKYTERINEGARTIDKVLGGLFTAVVEKVSEMQDKGEEYLGKKLEAVYDDQNNEFVIN